MKEKSDRASIFHEGLSEGARSAKLETARGMKAMDYPLADIVKLTGLSLEEISDL